MEPVCHGAARPALGVLGAGLAIGSVWEVWHWVPRIPMDASVSWLNGGLVLSMMGFAGR